jgi:hypothetical protein
MKGIHKERESFRIRNRRNTTEFKAKKKKKKLIDLEALIAEENAPLEDWNEDEGERLCSCYIIFEIIFR